MKLTEDDISLRIFISEKTIVSGKPLFEAIVKKADDEKLAGATVTRGIMGFGADRHIHSTKLLELSLDLPIIIEIVDTEESIQKILPYLDEVVQDGFVTMERVKVLKYRKKG